MNKLCSLCRGRTVFTAVSVGFNPNLIAVRFWRKPLYVPVAKSKMFRVPPRLVFAEAEEVEMKRLFQKYEKELACIQAFFAEENKRMMGTGAVGLSRQKEEDEQWEQILAENDAENSRLAEVRKQRLQQQLSDLETSVLTRVEEYNKERARALAKAESMVADQIARSKTYISKENIGKAVEQALGNPVDYNFAIDLRGNMYRGRTTKSIGLKAEHIEPWDPEDFRACVPANDLFSEAKRKQLMDSEDGKVQGSVSGGSMRNG